jgi:hypothetical protein
MGDNSWESVYNGLLLEGMWEAYALCNFTMITSRTGEVKNFFYLK